MAEREFRYNVTFAEFQFLQAMIAKRIESHKVAPDEHKVVAEA